MKRAQRLVFMFLALALTATGAAQAQEEERERDRREAERQLEEAQEQLGEALEQLRAAQSEDARRSLELAMDALRDAQFRLRFNEFRLADRIRDRFGTVEFFRDSAGFGSVIYAGGRPKIGVIVQTEESAETDSIGAELIAVSPGGPAEQAGLEAGDVITRANGESLARGRRDHREGPGHRLVEIVRSLDVGDTLRVEYRRGDEHRTATIVTEDMGSGAFAYSFSSDSFPMRLRGRLAPKIAMPHRPDIHIEVPDVWRLPTRWLGMELVTLDEELGEYFGTREGLLVVRAPRDESLNLKSGDVILSIDGRKPKSPSQALRIMRTYDVGESMNIEIMRNKRKTTVTATAPERDRGFFWEPRH